MTDQELNEVTSELLSRVENRGGVFECLNVWIFEYLFSWKNENREEGLSRISNATIDVLAMIVKALMVVLPSLWLYC